MTPYEFAISNTKDYIRGEENTKAILNGTQLDVFTAARVLAVAFVKGQHDVLEDLIRD